MDTKNFKELLKHLINIENIRKSKNFEDQPVCEEDFEKILQDFNIYDYGRDYIFNN